MSDALRPLRDRLRLEAQRQGVPLDVIEKDFALGHVLASVFRDDTLADALVFKGGTALKKAYFGEYRFSVDLDFTAVDGPRGDDLARLVQAAASEMGQRLLEQGPVGVSVSRMPERQAHPGGQEAFRVHVQFPWQGAPQCSIKLEITTDSHSCSPSSTALFFTATTKSWRRRCAATHLKRSSPRSCALCDKPRDGSTKGAGPETAPETTMHLWRLLTRPVRQVELKAAMKILPAKCEVREVTFESIDDFFTDAVLAERPRQWNSSLANLVRPLLPFQAAIEELRIVLANAPSPSEV